jgi:haloacetate dehalogenase
VRCFSDPQAIHSTTEDIRALAGIDVDDDRADLGRHRIRCPLLVLWAARWKEGDLLAPWRQWADDVRGRGLASGHFLAEECPEETLAELLAFLRSTPQ